MTWQYNTTLRRYQNSSTGRILSQRRVNELVDQSIDASSDIVADLARLGARGQLSRTDFEARMREQIKLAYIRQGVLGRGGRDQMDQAAWGSIGGQIAKQYVWLQRFSAELAAGKLTEGQAVVRARMYIRSSRQAYERGVARAHDLDLPQYPGDGQTRCRTNCQCHWELIEVTNEAGVIIGFDCYWRLDEAEHCPDCTRNARTWNPYFVRFPNSVVNP